MANSSYGTGTIYQRGGVYWVAICIDGKRIYESSGSTKRADAVKLREKLISKKHRGEVSGGTPDRVLVGELLDDVLKSDIEESTRYIWKLVIEKNIRPAFGKIKAMRLSTDLLDKYREKRIADGVGHSTVNRELSVLRTAFHNARKRTPPKVIAVPYFPIVKETTVRKGFLSDEVYSKLRDALEPELKALFVTAYLTGIRKGELLEIQWHQLDFKTNEISLDADETKGREGRTVPILDGDMREFLLAAKRERDKSWPDCLWVFNRSGDKIRDFRGGWKNACVAAGVPDLNFHDLRRTAVRNMRRDGVPQVIRMKISGHKTDSMERRYNIVDGADLAVAKEFMERGMKIRNEGLTL